jgi:very-short-patch-repair endonuclease
VIHGQVSPSEHVGIVQGLPCSTLVRATIEVAARRSLAHAVAVMDAGMREALTRDHADVRQAALDEVLRDSLLEEWDAAVAHYTRHRWVTTVREAIRRANPAAESFLESISRVAMIEGGLPQPRCGVPMLGDDGRTYWLDFWWDEARVIGEADGLGKYRERNDLLAEKLRQEALQPNAQALVRWGMAQVVPDPRPMLQRLRPALSPARSMGWSR